MKKIFCDSCGEEMSYPAGKPGTEHAAVLFGKSRAVTIIGQDNRELPLHVNLQVACDLDEHIDLCDRCRKYAFERATTPAPTAKEN